MVNDSKRNHDDLLKQMIDTTIQTPLRVEAANEQTTNESNHLSHEDLA
eukprot:CAMPEP_0119559666 /NCGR_PEP_ID=MMETSP1352-20130426/13051_1 /TAXON_ID=265584 /ORGANISM="Stauroneis constricta, Strain CCMP1120" /LENGTH=47 /DNA_ID= /DNA_START= /DNA_END= /DNA_ORIENTATION=